MGTRRDSAWPGKALRRSIAAGCFALALGAGARAEAHELTPPVPHEQPAASWPEGRASRHDVIVPVLLVVDAEGAVSEAAVEVSLGPAFDAEAIEVARRWRFEPAKSEGKAVKAKVRAVVRFVGDPKASEAVAPSAAPPSPAPAPALPDPIVPVGHGESAHERRGEVRVVGDRPPPRSASEVVRERPVLSAAPHRTANDLLLTVPGVALVQHGGEGDAYQIFYRGFDAVHGQDLEIWAGGAPVNDVSNLHGQGYADLHFLPPEVVRQIRSTPGSYDPRQGDFAVAGSLQLDLGYDQPGITAKAAAGSFGTRRYFLAYRPESAGEQTFLAAEFYSTDGFGPARAARRASAVGQTEYPLGETANLRLMASTYATSYSSAGVLRLSDIETGRVGRYDTYDPNQGGDAARTQLVAEIRDLSDKARWSFAPYAVVRSMRLRQNFTGYYEQPVPGVLGEDPAIASKSGNSEQIINDATTFGLRGYYRVLMRVFDRADSFEAGVSARYDRVSQSQKRLAVADSRVTLDEVDAKVHATDIGGYFDAALHPIKRVTLRAGARVDGLSYSTQDNGGLGQGQRRSAQGAHLGKKATAEVFLLRGLSAVASYGEGFRSPQARSLAANETTPFTRVTSLEAGVRYQEGTFRGSAAAFRTSLSDDLAFDQATARNERTPATRRTGVTAELAATPEPWLVSSASVTYTRSAFSQTAGGYREGDLLPYSPQVVARSDLAFTPLLGHLWGRELRGHLGAGLTFFGARPLPYGEFGHDVFLVDASASVRLKEVQLGVEAFNLLDARWYEGQYTFASNFTPDAAPSLVPQRHVTVGAPRTLLATLSIYL
jgi:TonB family protein